MIDLTEILKDVPVGTPLYSPVLGPVKFMGLASCDTTICVEHVDGHYRYLFFGDGRFKDLPGAECMLFPSKENRDWEKFRKKRLVKMCTPVMVSDCGKIWYLRYYYKGDKVFRTMNELNEGDPVCEWRYIVPAKNFNFDDLMSNTENSIAWI